MPIAKVQLPDGRIARLEVPDGTTPQQVESFAMENFSKGAKGQFAENTDPVTGVAAKLDKKLQTVPRDLALGALKGATNIGSTLLRPVDAATDALGLTKNAAQERKAKLGEFYKENADPESLASKGGELASEIAGTAGAGPVVAAGAKAIPIIAKYAPKLVAAIESGGFKLGTPAATTTAGKVADATTRVAGGAITGGASAGLVNPSDATTGAVIGGALPPAVKVAGAAGKALASEVSPEVVALYNKAKSLGIDVPADRITNSKPLNAVASSLNYVPLSGRAGTEEKMASQFNRAVSRTFGQDSDNVTSALRKASTALGDKFELTLKGTGVKADQDLINDLVTNIDKANRELGPDSAKIIGNMADDLMGKIGANGMIDGQAAYNVKKALDRIGSRNSNEAYYAREMKKSLMGALNRSLGPDEAKAFAKVRQEYGNMLDLEGIAQNGAEGGVSIARLANMKNINNQPLQELADIAAQFLKTRESSHGAAQRVAMAVTRGGLLSGGATSAALAPASIPLVAGGIAAGRAANTALNSNALKDLMLDQAGTAAKVHRIAGNKTLRALMYNEAN